MDADKLKTARLDLMVNDTRMRHKHQSLNFEERKMS